MVSPALKDYFDALCCPTCQGGLLLTKERIVFCQTCLVGYRAVGNIPDLRVEQAISFRKSVNVSGHTVLLNVILGEALTRSLTLSSGHGVLLGRAAQEDGDDVTMAGRVGMESLDAHTKKLIDSVLTCKGRSNFLPYDLGPNGKSHLGDFRRDADFVFFDVSVSRQHAVVYHGHDGVWVLDLVSKNGTFVNGREVENAKLKNNDVLSLGQVSLKVGLL
jgi:uncharacterized protein YbaR (Trm112 family)